MTNHAVCLLTLPEPDRAAAAKASASAEALAGALPGSVVMPPARTLREFVREQLAAVPQETVVIVSRRVAVTNAEVDASLGTLNADARNLGGPAYRTASLRAALRAPLVDLDEIYDEVADAWLALNLAAVAGSPARFTTLADVATARETLRLLALTHRFLCRCPLLPEVKPLREAGCTAALKAWRRHHRVLPAAAELAASKILSHTTDLSWAARLQFRFWLRILPSSAGREFQPVLAEIERYIPGFFGRAALGEMILQPPE